MFIIFMRIYCIITVRIYIYMIYMMSVCVRMDMLLSYSPQVIYWLSNISQTTLL